MTGVGSVAVFVSDNQAGTASAFVVGLVMLVVGIQGTPLRKFGGGGYQVDLSEIRSRGVQAIDAAVQTESPETAAAVSDAVRYIDPGIVLARPPAEQYNEAVLQAIRRAGGVIDPSHRDGPGDRGVDARVKLPTGTINVQVKYRSRGALGSRDIEMVERAFRVSGFDGGFVLITNAPLSAEALDHNSRSGARRGDVEVMTWNDERDDDLLVRVLSRNAR